MIRDRETHELLYIGHSHSGRLRNTLRRHFQKWDDPRCSHAVYDPEIVEVRWRVCADEYAHLEEIILIGAMDPKDNLKRYQPTGPRAVRNPEPRAGAGGEVPF